MAVPKVLSIDTEVKKRFWNFVDFSGQSKCWNWLGAKGGTDKRASFTFQKGGKKATVNAARFMYELTVGQIPSGRCVLHTCNNPACVQPSHLFIGTKADNNQDRAEKGRSADTHGEKNPNHKLTKKEVRQIREEAELGLTALGRRYNIDPSQVWNILRRKQWANV